MKRVNLWDRVSLPFDLCRMPRNVSHRQINSELEGVNNGGVPFPI